MRLRYPVHIPKISLFLIILFITTLFLVQPISADNPCVPPTNLSYIQSTYELMFTPGWNLFSVPMNTTIAENNVTIQYNNQNHSWFEATTLGILRSDVFEWNTTTQNYSALNQLILHPGKGYWVWANVSCSLVLEGIQSTDGYITNLSSQWNLLGQPYNTTTLTSSIMVHYNGTRYSWVNATSANNSAGYPLISFYISTWNPLNQTYNLTTEFMPGAGLWVYAYEPCTLFEQLHLPTITDNSLATTTTGDVFIGNATITHVEEITDVWMEYWFSHNPPTSMHMVPTGIADFYEVCIPVPSTTNEPLHYRIYAVDQTFFWNTTNENLVQVLDNDAPILGALSITPTPISENTFVNISCPIQDNIALATVSLTITYPNTTTTTVPMMHGPTYFYNTTYTQPGTYQIFIQARDTSNNTNTSAPTTFIIQKNTLLLDSEFSETLDSDELRNNASSQDWYESRNDNPLLVTLDTTTVGGNSGNKAAFLTQGVSSTVYLSQEFTQPQTTSFTTQLDIYLDQLSDYSNYDRTGFIFLGTDADTTNGPCSTSNDRYICLAFYDATPNENIDDLMLKARESSTQSWSTTAQWTTIATNLSYHTWYTIQLDVNVTNGTYAVYLNDTLLDDNLSKYDGYTSSSITHITFSAGGTARGDFYIDNVHAPQQQRHHLTIHTEGSGSVNCSPGESSYQPGTTILLEAVASPGSVFTEWNGSITSTDNPLAYTITNDTTLTAYFTQINYPLTTSCEGNGSILVNPQKTWYQYLDTVEVTALPDQDWSFHQWTGNLSGNQNPIHLQITGNTTITAHFTQTPLLQLTASFDSGSIGTYHITDNTINFSLNSEYLVNSGANYTYWMFFRVYNTMNKTVFFNITNAFLVPFLAQSTHESHLVYSYDGVTWYRLRNHSYAEGIYSFHQHFIENDVYIATFYPFSYANMQSYLQEVNTSQWATISVLGTSEQHRNISLLTITNPMISSTGKKVVYIIGRQHPAETTSSHMLKGMIDFLISNNSDAQRLRDSFIWYIIPMVNPDGVFLGNTRGTALHRDCNDDWSNTNSVEINSVKNHLTLIHTSSGVDVFIDWHSHLNDIRWYHYIYAPFGNTFFPLLSQWTCFDSQETPGTGPGSARWYATTLGIFTFTFEPTPHLSTWTLPCLHNEGVHTALAIDEYFPLLQDSEFTKSNTSDILRANATTQDWYESRQRNAELLNLDTNNIMNNTGTKASLLADEISTYAYLTQELRTRQTGRFTISLDILIDTISSYYTNDPENPAAYQEYNRTGFIFVGADADQISGPCSTSSERFVFLTFYDHTPTNQENDIELRARTLSSQRWNDTAQWTTIATNLSYDTWYTLTLDIDVTTKTYLVHINNTLIATVPAYSGYTPNYLEHISFYVGGTARGEFYVDNIYAPATQRHSLIVTSQGNGTIQQTPGESTYANNTELHLTATPQPGWSFSHWTGDINTTHNPLTITINQTTHITAVFTQDEYTLTTTTIGAGTITITPVQTTYHYHDIITVTATPTTGWVFTHWSTALQGHLNPETYIIQNHTSITAHFSTTAIYTLTTHINGSGTIITTPDQALYEPNTIVTLTASPHQGWTFHRWTGDISTQYQYTNPVQITLTANKILTLHVNNSQPHLQTLQATNITSTTATLWGNLSDTGGESCSTWFEWDNYELEECMGIIATGTVCKDGRSIVQKNRHYNVENQKPYYYQGWNYSYFGIGHIPGMCRMGQNEKGLALVNMDIGGAIKNWEFTTDWSSGSEDNDYHIVLGNYSTVADAAYFLAHHGNYGHGANNVFGQYLIISSEPGVGAIVGIDYLGHTNITWINNTYAACANAWYCDGKIDTGDYNDVKAKRVLDDIYFNSTSSDGDNLINWQDVAQRVAKDTSGRELGTGSYYYGKEISNGMSRASSVHVAGNLSFNSSIHMSWLSFGETTQVSIFLPLYAGNLHSENDIPSNFTHDNNEKGIHPYVTAKKMYARGSLANNNFYCDRVREILHYTSYNENLTFSAFDDILDTAMYAANDQEIRTQLSNMVNTTLPRALHGYIHNSTNSSYTTFKQYPCEIGIFSETITNLTPGTIYYVKAWANNTGSESNGTQTLFMTPPQEPQNATAQPLNETQIKLAWNKGAGAQFTIIERNASNVPAWDQGSGIPIYNGTGTSYVDTTTANIQYYYQLWSYTIKKEYQHYSNTPATVFTGGDIPQQILTDPLFDTAYDSNELRNNSLGIYDWYESRGTAAGGNPHLVTLDTTTLAGNNGKKVKFIQSNVSNAYLSQEFNSIQTQTFTVQWDIYVDTILNITSGNPDRTGWMLIGDDTDGINGPSSTNDDRYMILAFAKDGGGTTGVMNLVARDRDDTWTTFTPIATNLLLDNWYQIKVIINLSSDTYDVYVDGIYQATVTSRTIKDSVTHLSFAQWNDGAGTFYIDNVFATSSDHNNPPLIINEHPQNAATQIPVSLQQLSAYINDADNDPLSYTIETSPYVGSLNESNQPCGIKTLNLSNLSYTTTYQWYVNVTDGKTWTYTTYSFTTESAPINHPPMFSTPWPSDGAYGVPQNLSTLQITIEDPEGDTMNWTIQTSPYIGENVGVNHSNGTKTCTLTNLVNNTWYTWFVNCTDGTNWMNQTILFKTQEGLLSDPEFNASTDTSDLRLNTHHVFDWYESRNDNPNLVTLDTTNVGGNTGKKAAFFGANTSSTAYLSQEFSISQTGEFTVTMDVYIDRISDYSNYDRTVLIYLGNDLDGTNGPCSTGSERFVHLAFYDATPGETGDDMMLKVRKYKANQSWSATSSWTTVATNLSYKTWYSLSITIDAAAGTYDVYLNNTLLLDNIPRYDECSSTFVDFVTFSVGGSGRGDFYVDSVSATP